MPHCSEFLSSQIYDKTKSVGLKNNHPNTISIKYEDLIHKTVMGVRFLKRPKWAHLSLVFKFAYEALYSL